MILSCLDSGNGIAFSDFSDSTMPSFTLPNGSIFASSIMSISAGVHSIGKSKNQGLCGGGNEVLKRIAISLASSQLSCNFVSALCQFLRIWNWAFSSSLSSGCIPGIPSGNFKRSRLDNSMKSSIAFWDDNSSIKSLAHQSLQYPAGTNFLLFSMNSP